MPSFWIASKKWLTTCLLLISYPLIICFDVSLTNKSWIHKCASICLHLYRRIEYNPGKCVPIWKKKSNTKIYVIWYKLIVYAMVAQVQGPEEEDGVISIFAGAVGAAGVLIISTVIVFIVLFKRCVFSLTTWTKVTLWFRISLE